MSKTHGTFLATSTPQTIRLGILEEGFAGFRCIYLLYWEVRVLVDTGMTMRVKEMSIITDLGSLA